MQSKQYYEWVKASDELPEEKAGHYSARVLSNIIGYDYYGMYHENIYGQHNVTINGKTWIEQDELNVIEWLRPVSGVLLSAEEYEGLMKCVEALRTIEGGYLVNASQIQPFCRQIIAQLPETIKTHQ